MIPFLTDFLWFLVGGYFPLVAPDKITELIRSLISFLIRKLLDEGLHHGFLQEVVLQVSMRYFVMFVELSFLIL